MELTLTAEAQAIIEQEMQQGRFQSPGDLIETALLAFRDTVAFDSRELDGLIQSGLDDIDKDSLLTEEEARAYLRAMRARL